MAHYQSPCHDEGANQEVAYEQRAQETLLISLFITTVSAGTGYKYFGFWGLVGGLGVGAVVFLVLLVSHYAR